VAVPTKGVDAHAQATALLVCYHVITSLSSLHIIEFYSTLHIDCWLLQAVVVAKLIYSSKSELRDCSMTTGEGQPASAVAWRCSDPHGCWVAVVAISDFVVSMRRLEKRMGTGRVKVYREKNNYSEPRGTESDFLCECPTDIVWRLTLVSPDCSYNVCRIIITTLLLYYFKLVCREKVIFFPHPATIIIIIVMFVCQCH